MARQILPIAGQIIGGMIGGPVGAAIGGALGSAIGQYVDPIRHQGPKLGEARAQTAQEGVYRPLVFGTGCVAGNVIHRSPRKVVVHREDASGKGNRDTVDSERGYRTFAIRIAEAHTPEGYALLRIWENETLVYDVRPESEILEESIEYAKNFRFYEGTQDQLPDPDLEAYMGVGNVNAYRGSCYIVFGNYDLTDYGDMVPQYRFEISSNESAGFVYEYLPWQVNQVNRVWTPPEGTTTVDVLVVGSGGSGSGAGGLTPSIAGPGGGGGQVVLTTGVPVSGHVPVFVGQGGAVNSDKGQDSSFGDIVAMGGSRGDRGNGFNGGGGPAGSTSGSAPGHPGNGGSTGGSGVYTPGGQWGIGSGGGGGGMGGHGGSSASGGGHGGVGKYVEEFSQFGDNGYFGGGGGGAYANPAIDLYVLHNGGLGGGGRGGMRISSGEDPIYAPQPGIDGTGGGGGGTRFSDQGSGGDGGIYLRYAASTTDHLLTLAQIVEFCHRRVGQPADDFDVSELDDVVDGVVFADGYTARDAIMALLPIYNADASEHDRGSGYSINYIKRGAPVVRTLTADDLVDEPEETVREDPMERPRVLHMAFESPVTGYTAAKASIQRLSPDVRLVNEVSTYVPVTFKDVDEAWQRADVHMRVAWTEVNGERKFSISDAHLDLVPTDNVALALRCQVQRLRLGKGEYADGVIKLESVADRQSNYTSNVTGIPLPEPSPPPPSLMGPAALAILDIPAVSDRHDRLGYYVAVTVTADAFAGAVVQRQQNGAWADVVSIGRSQRATMGVLDNAVSAGSQHYTDTTNTVSVTLYMDAELESLSNAQWLNKGGAFALETATGWEIMQYRDAYQDSGGVWHLTHLARGRLNTPPDEHLPGARFVMLSGAQFIDADVGMIDQPLTLRAAAVGRSPETAVPQTITYQGNSQREFPLAHLFGEEDSGTLTLEAVPRDRFGTETHPLRSINHDGFRWTATDGSATVATDTDHATATLDVSALGSPITATVAQLNRFTGAGPTVSELIE